MFRVAAGEIVDRLDNMGAKYLPTIKDQKASQRFQRKQLVQSKLIKPVATPPAANQPAKKREK